MSASRRWLAVDNAGLMFYEVHACKTGGSSKSHVLKRCMETELRRRLESWGKLVGSRELFENYCCCVWVQDGKTGGQTSVEKEEENGKHTDNGRREQPTGRDLGMVLRRMMA